MGFGSGNNLGMARRKHRLPVIRTDQIADGDLYIGSWIAFMGKKAVQVARDAGISEGYLSALISGKHDKDPTLSMLKAVAKAIGVPVQALFVPPPDKAAVAAEYALRGLRRGFEP
jgi:transcriptional regulator with XRE-family HTH domain